MSEVDNQFFEDFGRAFEQFKSTNNEKIEALEKGETGKAKELSEKLYRIEQDLGNFEELKGQFEREQKANEAMKERLEQLEASRDLPGPNGQSKESRQYEELFTKWIRSQCQDTQLAKEMRELSQKDVSIGTPAAGGYAVPEVISTMIEKLEYKLSDVLNEVKTVTVGTSDYKELVDIGGATSAWAGETDTRNATVTPTLREVAPTMGEQYAYVTASEWSLDDIFFDVATWLAESAAEQFALGSSLAIWQGTGSNQPTGMTLTSPVTTADQASPLRAATVYQYISNSTSPVGTIQASKLIELAYSINRTYMNGASWASNRTVMSEIRQLADSNGQYLWQPGLAAGEPNTLLGYRHWIWEDMPNSDDEEECVAFGNWNRAYLRVVRTGTRITMDNVTAAGFVKWYIRRREGGKPLNNDAVKFLKCQG